MSEGRRENVNYILTKIYMLYCNYKYLLVKIIVRNSLLFILKASHVLESTFSEENFML